MEGINNFEFPCYSEDTFTMEDILTDEEFENIQVYKVLKEGDGAVMMLIRRCRTL